MHVCTRSWLEFHLDSLISLLSAEVESVIKPPAALTAIPCMRQEQSLHASLAKLQEIVNLELNVAILEIARKHGTEVVLLSVGNFLLAADSGDSERLG